MMLSICFFCLQGFLPLSLQSLHVSVFQGDHQGLSKERKASAAAAGEFPWLGHGPRSRASAADRSHLRSTAGAAPPEAWSEQSEQSEQSAGGEAKLETTSSKKLGVGERVEYSGMLIQGTPVWESSLEGKTYVEGP